MLDHFTSSIFIFLNLCFFIFTLSPYLQKLTSYLKLILTEVASINIEVIKRDLVEFF